MNEFLKHSYFGFYNNVFVRTAYLHNRADNSLTNYFTLIYGIEDASTVTPNNQLFGKISEKYNYGLYERVENLDWVKKLYNNLKKFNLFEDNGIKVTTGDFHFIPKSLVERYSDTSPFNLTTSNYASYTYEFFDSHKSHLEELLVSDELITRINKTLKKNNIDLTQNLERIGNIIIEFPNNLIKKVDRNNGIDLNIEFDPRFSDASSLKFILTKNTRAFNSLEIIDLVDNTIKFSERKKHQTCQLICPIRNLVLMTGFNCRGMSLHLSLSTMLDVKRTITDTGETISIQKPPNISLAGDPLDKVDIYIKTHQNNKKINEDIEDLTSKQYGIENLFKPKEVRHQESLEDLWTLIDQKGGRGVCIWDPYLCASDLINLLIRRYKTTAHIRALGSKKVYLNIERDKSVDISKRLDWFKDQREILNKSSDHVGLNIEFRCAHTIPESNFHDRFIIFPEVGPEHSTEAWSLGISLNQFGIEHHILQKIEFPNLILLSFNRLWDKLNDNDKLVFKKNYTI